MALSLKIYSKHFINIKHPAQCLPSDTGLCAFLMSNKHSIIITISIIPARLRAIFTSHDPSQLISAVLRMIREEQRFPPAYFTNQVSQAKDPFFLYWQTGS